MYDNDNPFLMAIAILNHGDGTPFVKDAIKYGLRGGFISPSKGLIKSALLNLLSIRHDKRDFVMVFERQNKLMPALDQLSQKWQMNLANHGVIFVFPVQFSLRNDSKLEDNDWQGYSSNYQLVVMSFKHGKVFDVLQHINAISDENATIFTGKGEYSQEMQKLLGITFAPQKDVVLSVVNSQKVKSIFDMMENTYACSQTKGMFVYSLNVMNYSHFNEDSHYQKSLLISIVDEELEEEYIHKMKQYELHGGTSLKAYGFVSKDMKEDVLDDNTQPQQKIIMTIDETDKVQHVYQKLVNSDKMNGKNNSIFFTIPILKTYGLYDE